MALRTWRLSLEVSPVTLMAYFHLHATSEQDVGGYAWWLEESGPMSRAGVDSQESEADARAKGQSQSRESEPRVRTGLPRVKPGRSSAGFKAGAITATGKCFEQLLGLRAGLLTLPTSQAEKPIRQPAIGQLHLLGCLRSALLKALIPETF